MQSKLKVAILTSPNQWFIPYAKELESKIPNAKLYLSHKDLKESYGIVFILSYHQLIEQEFLDLHEYNLVIHASALPKGKGWSPLFWQVLEGKDSIVFTLFNADAKADNGAIYLQETLHLSGLELYEELREKQAKMCQKLCLEFLEKFPTLSPKAQSGAESFYPKRTPKDSQMDITKSLESQFNLLRIVSNEEFPAFFIKDGKKFVLKIYAYDSWRGGGDNLEILCLELEDYVVLGDLEKKEVLQWRNHPDVAKNLYNQNKISLAEHFAFIESLKQNPKKRYFILRFCGVGLGSINFSKKNSEEAEFGFFSNPCLGISGIGRILEQVSLLFGFDILGARRLSLEVFESNKQVVNLHRKFGFQIIGRKKVNGENVLKMLQTQGV